jgi:hypothetical protein
VPGPDVVIPALAASFTHPFPLFGTLLAYGPAPGVELIPYFLGLLAWAGLALSAVFISPLTALWRRLRKGRGAPPAEAKGEAINAPVPESSGDGTRDSA